MRVLLVEDEALVALMVEDMLGEVGCDHVTTAARLDEALEAARTGTWDCAILDLSLAGTFTYPVADTLRERGIPFAFATGYGAAGLQPGYETAPTLQKPFQLDDLQRAVFALVG